MEDFWGTGISLSFLHGSPLLLDLRLKFEVFFHELLLFGWWHVHEGEGVMSIDGVCCRCYRF